MGTVQILERPLVARAGARDRVAHDGGREPNGGVPGGRGAVLTQSWDRDPPSGTRKRR